MNRDQRERWMQCTSDAIWYLLNVFPAKDRIFVLAELMSRITRKLKNRESTRYSMTMLDNFIDSEPPTDPQIDAEDKDRLTRTINVDVLRDLQKKSREKP